MLKGVIVFFVFFIYLFFAFLYQENVIPQGDEVHYLVMTYSIVKDHDIWLENNYAQGDQLFFNPDVLDRIAVKGLDGHEYLIHGIGFPFLLAPFYAIGERIGVVFFHALSAFLLFIITLVVSKRITASENISLLVTTMVFLSIPVFNFSVLSFTEIIGALILAISFLRIILAKDRDYWLVVLLGLLPWIHIRFLFLSVVFFYFWLLNQQQKSTHKVLIYVLLIISYFIFLKLTFGSFSPYKPFELLGHFPTQGNMSVNLINLLIDRQYGLFINTPLFIFIIPGAYLWFKQNRKTFLMSSLLTIIYIIPILRNSDWQGGYTPPARFLVVILPLWVPAIVLFFKYFKNFLIRLLAITFYIWGNLIMIISLFFSPNHGFIYSDGISPSLWFVYLQTGINLHQLFPAYYPKISLLPLHLVWVIILIIFWSICFFIIKKKINLQDIVLTDK